MMLFRKRPSSLCLVFLLLVYFVALTCELFDRNRRVATHNELRHSERERCFHSIQNEILTRLQTMIPSNAPVLLLGTVAHQNLGDHFIWLGEEIALQKAKHRVLYRCTMQHCRTTTVRTYLEKHNQTVICLQGGGNFGDLYRVEVEMKLRMITAFLTHRIVLFPQSIYYRNITQMQEDILILGKHKDLHLAVRSNDSYTLIEDYFSSYHGKYLMPDMAFMLGALKPMCQPMYDVIFLRRTDQESILKHTWGYDIIQGLIDAELSYQVLDWANIYNSTNRPKDNRLPLQALETANYQLSQGRIIVTDRLHAAVLAVLIDRPVVCLDNIYGKIRSVTAVLDRSSSCRSVRRQYATSAMQALFHIKSYLSTTPKLLTQTCHFRMRSLFPAVYSVLKGSPLY
jgi:exopolysaccharide biosynthesis predicted pyruvyltransferase EpsI